MQLNLVKSVFFIFQNYYILRQRFYIFSAQSASFSYNLIKIFQSEIGFRLSIIRIFSV